MLLGGYARMTFLDFFIYKGKPSMFFATQVGALFSFIVLYFVFRSHREQSALTPVEKVKSWWPTILLGVLILALAGSSFVDKDFKWLAGTLCMAFGVGMLIPGLRRDPSRIVANMRQLDWDTTFFLMGIFVIVESLTATGWVDNIAQFMAGMVGGSVFWGYVTLVVFSMVFSGFVDNVPFLAAMLPVAGALARDMNTDPVLFLFGLLLGASLGGNITPIGASANIVGAGLLRKEGHTVTFLEFGKISIPFTLAAIIPASIFVWMVWGP
jgi:Na+/H+ antiporter NhaD/arsenite permease-like protein